MKSRHLTTVAVVIAVMIGIDVCGCRKEETAREKSSSMKEGSYKRCKILFQSYRDGRSDIYIMNADGSEQKNLTNNLVGGGHPSWSPDGRKIVFVSGRDANDPEIYVMNADGSEQKRLTDNPAAYGFLSWSPDGKMITFVVGYGPKDNAEAMEWYEKNGVGHDNYEIYVMNADGSNLKRLTDNPPYADYSPYWSPDGRKIAFTSNRDGNYEIYVMNRNGSKEKRLTNNFALDIGSLWSPDGKKMLFISNRDGNYDIYVMNADGSEQTPLTNSPATDYGPSWSPDGKRIAYVSMHGPKDARGSNRNFEIHVMNADGSDRKKLTDNPGLDWRLSWSPDGKRIAFQSDHDGNREIYVMDPNGAERKRLTNSTARAWGPSWSPIPGSE